MKEKPFNTIDEAQTQDNNMYVETKLSSPKNTTLRIAKEYSSAKKYSLHDGIDKQFRSLSIGEGSRSNR